ncbi:Ig-like domain-containing protein [Pseudomonas sp. NIBR-H-19]|uniref:Ig-like domain-containing protein n=1 Tax=Pseudomonas TaxID=286 RepID=UPI001E2C0B02|nr:Ig-like domain-containing protein [Pseudomonas sp. NIBR-H-19]UHC82541.1 Ig-like domain-containing protein [Pseudomonas sp. NIBR-H-19]
MDNLKKFEMDESSVSITGSAHSLQAHSALMPEASADTTYQRQPAGGKKPYSFKVDNSRVAHVDDQGLVTALSAGQVTVTATDANGEQKSYLVSIPKGNRYFFFGSGQLSSLQADANRERVRLADINELRILHQRFGYAWPLNNGQFWSTTGSADNPEPPPPRPIETGINVYTKNMKNGAEQTNDTGHVFEALGRNL